MASSYKRTRDVERQYVQLELADGWVRILSRVILLVLSVALTVVSAICALRGYRWPIVGGAEVSSAALATRLLTPSHAKSQEGRRLVLLHYMHLL
jgi:hypothetical protein